jgi:hypothetical protein
MRVASLIVVVALVLGAGVDFARSQTGPTPLIHAHAHNDYLHARPLRDALSHGFCSVEADIFLVDDQLLVAHNLKDTKTGRTLQKLYLDPLRERVKQNGGRVFPNGPEFTLLIDLKTDWTNTYPALRSVLTNYANVLTTFRGDDKQTNAITVIVSGNRDKKMFVDETVRFACYDGTPDDLDSATSANMIPWISADWKKQFTWDGSEEMSSAEKQKLAEFVGKAHRHGRRVRFWGTPDTPQVWRTLLDAEVDLINTDVLAGLEKVLRSR